MCARTDHNISTGSSLVTRDSGVPISEYTMIQHVTMFLKIIENHVCSTELVKHAKIKLFKFICYQDSRLGLKQHLCILRGGLPQFIPSLDPLMWELSPALGLCPYQSSRLIVYLIS
jgi:hypothetical protein